MKLLAMAYDAFLPSSLLFFSFFLTALLILPLILLFFSLSRKSAGSRLRPPGPSRLPIIGNLHLLGDMPHRSLEQLAKKYGDLMFLQLGQVPTIVISSARLARQVMKTHDHAFASRPALLSAQYLSYGCSDVTFSPYGPYWRQARKICVTELLGSRRIQSFQHIREEEIGRLVASIGSLADRLEGGGAADLSDAFFGLANNILCRVAFGKRFSKGGLNEILTETQALFAGFSVGDFFPSLRLLDVVTGLTGRLKANLRDLDRISSEIIAEHVDPGRPPPAHKDFVDVLLQVQREGNLDVPISDDNIKALVLDMFVAGTDTTSATLEWTMTELMRHPEVMRRTQDEIRSVARKGGTITESDLADLAYMRAVIKEALRLHLPVPLLVPRESIEPCELDGYIIPAKTRVLVNAYAIARDPHSWDDPETYRPERFLEKPIDFKGSQDFEFLPFGGGRRGCPGYSFGLATVELALARLLCHFDWSLADGVSLESLNLEEIFGLATRKKEPLLLIPRHSIESGFKLI
ncbi:cytochrome P450 71AP13-like [Nymphaea colorata]|nr:cytochrome P450 71AP13-like [Nymphaea colorata]